MLRFLLFVAAAVKPVAVIWATRPIIRGHLRVANLSMNMPAKGLRTIIASPKIERTIEMDDWISVLWRPTRVSSMYGRMGTMKVARNVSVFGFNVMFLKF